MQQRNSSLKHLLQNCESFMDRDSAQPQKYSAEINDLDYRHNDFPYVTASQHKSPFSKQAVLSI
jgi:hypothetical protein